MSLMIQKMVTYRKAIIRDLDSLLYIEERCFIDKWSECTFFEILTTNESKELGLKNIDTLVAEYKNRIIGFIIYSTQHNTVHIINLAVLPEFRRNKIATELLTRTINDAKYKKCKRIILEVSTTNQSAINLYKKWDLKK